MWSLPSRVRLLLSETHIQSEYHWTDFYIINLDNISDVKNDITFSK